MRSPRDESRPRSTRQTVARVDQRSVAYPDVLRARLGDDAPACLYVMGNQGVLNNRLTGLLCSIQCPGSAIIRTYDAIRLLRDGGVSAIGGFHSPMERECLDILLRGDQPVVICPARRLTGVRLGRNVRQPVIDGQVLVLSPFGETVRRTTATQALRRNELLAALADAILVPHAAPGGKTWITISSALARQRAVFTFDIEDNRGLLAAGARPFAELSRTIIGR